MIDVKNTVACIVALLLVFNVAFASPMDMSKSPLDELNFDIFRYICSNFVKTSEISTEQNKDNSIDSESQGMSKKYRTMRDVAGAMCVADSVYQVIVDGVDATKVVYRSGTKDSLYECYFTYDSKTKKSRFTYEDITRGSIFYVGLTDKRFVTNYAVMAVVNKGTKTFDVDQAAVAMNFNSEKVSYSYSYITDIFEKDGNTIVTLANGDDLVVADDAGEFVYHNYERNNKVYGGDFWRFNVGVPRYDEENDVTEVYMVFAMTFDDETVAICSITTPSYIKGKIEE